MGLFPSAFPGVNFDHPLLEGPAGALTYSVIRMLANARSSLRARLLGLREPGREQDLVHPASSDCSRLVTDVVHYFPTIPLSSSLFSLIFSLYLSSTVASPVCLKTTNQFRAAYQPESRPHCPSAARLLRGEAGSMLNCGESGDNLAVTLVLDLALARRPREEAQSRLVQKRLEVY